MNDHFSATRVCAALISAATFSIPFFGTHIAEAAQLPPLSDFASGQVLKSVDMTAIVQSIADLQNTTTTGSDNGVFNVKAYGADSTGTNDSAPAFVAAIQNGSNIFVPPGTYRLNSQVAATIAKHIRITGAGRGVTTLNCYSTNGCLSITETDPTETVEVTSMRFAAMNTGAHGTGLSVTYPQAASNIFAGAILQDLWFVGSDYTANTFSTAISLTGAWNSYMQEITINGAAANQTAALNGIQLNCGSLAAHGSKLSIYHVQNAVNINDASCDVSGQRVEGMYFSDFEFVGVQYGFYGAHPSLTSGSVIANGHINAFLGGIWLANQVQLSIHDMLIYKTASGDWSGITLQGGGDNDIHDNRIFGLDFNGANNGIVIAGSSARNTIHHNEFKYFNSNGAGVLLADTADANTVEYNDADQTFAAYPAVSITTTGTGNNIHDNHPDNAYQRLAANSATPSIANATINQFLTANTVGTTITSFTGGIAGRVFTIVANDNNTTLQHNSTLILSGGLSYKMLIGDSITFRVEPTLVREVARSGTLISPQIGIGTGNTVGSLTVANGTDHTLNVRGDPVSFGLPSGLLGPILQGVNSAQNTNEPITLYGAGINLMGGGNVGIGTTNPTAQLQTTGTVRFANFGAGTLSTDASGNLSVSSDERLKSIQGAFSRGLAEILKLNPILYQWKPETGYDASTTYAGFSAQNVQTAIPEAVGQDSRGYLTLQDRPLVAALVNAVKEIDTTVMKFSDTFTTHKLCVDDVCVTRDQFLRMMQSAGSDSQ